MKIALNKLKGNEKGQAFILALILLAVGGLIIAPLLSYMSTGLNVGRVFEERMDEVYAADAGIEFGIWKLENDPPASYPYPYPDPLNVNGKDVSVTIYEELFQVYKITATAGSTTTESYVSLLHDYAALSTGEGKIDLKGHAVINGSIYSVGKIKKGKKGKDVIVTGDEIEYGDPIDFGIDPEYYKTLAQSGYTHHGNKIINSDEDLETPWYIEGILRIKENVDVILNGTVYVMGSIEIGEGATITGTGNLLTENEDDDKESIKIGKKVTIATDNIPLIMAIHSSAKDKIKVEEECVIKGIIYAKYGKVEIKGKKLTSVEGALIGTTVKVDKESVITYIPGLEAWGSGGTLVSIDYAITSTGKGKIELKDNVVINGDVYSVGEVKKGKHVIVTGGTRDFGDPVDLGIDPEDYKAEAQIVPTHTGDLEIKSDQSLGPLYITGNLKIKKGKDRHIILTGTVYVEGTIEIEEKVRITGTGNLVAANQEDEKDAIKIKKNVTITPDDPDNIFLIMAVSGDKIKVEEGCNITAVIYSKYGKVEVKGKKPTFINGAVLGAVVKVDKNSVITYNECLNKWEAFGLQILTFEINPS